MLTKLTHLPYQKEAGGITRADLRHLLERPGGTQPRLQRSQITELFNVLDPEHTGVIQLASLERFNPSITSAPTGNTAPPPSPPNTAEPLHVPEETDDTTTEMVCLYNHLLLSVHFLVAHFHIRTFKCSMLLIAFLQEEQKTPDERQTTQWADKVSVASPSWKTVSVLTQHTMIKYQAYQT